jgi:uncharacterized protein (DUF4415 family)
MSSPKAPKLPPVVFDDENPEWTKGDFDRARPIADYPALAAAFPKARGRPFGSTKPVRKEQIALRVDADVLEKYKAKGRGWQTRMNEVLRAGVGA